MGVSIMAGDLLTDTRDDEAWYVSSARSRHGALDSEAESQHYEALLQKVSAAGIACSWLTRDQQPASDHSGLKRLAKKFRW